MIGAAPKTSPTSNQTTLPRALLGVALPAVVLTVAYVPFLISRRELPDRVATHFDLSGEADGSMTVAAFLATTGVMIAVGLGLSIGLALWRRPIPPAWSAGAGFGGPFVAGFGAALVAWTSLGQRGNVRWQDASGADGAWWAMLIVFTFALVPAAMGARTAALLPAVTDDVDRAAVPTMMLSSDEHAVWAVTERSRWLHWLGVGLVLVGVASLLTTDPWVAGVVALAGLLTVSLASLRIRVDERGLHVGYGFLPWPRTRLPLDRIEAASVIDVRPMEWGGWGYRGAAQRDGAAPRCTAGPLTGQPSGPLPAGWSVRPASDTLATDTLASCHSYSPTSATASPP